MILKFTIIIFTICILVKFIYEFIESYFSKDTIIYNEKKRDDSKLNKQFLIQYLIIILVIVIPIFLYLFFGTWSVTKGTLGLNPNEEIMIFGDK